MYLEQYINEKGLAKSTIELYRASVNAYQTVTKKKFDELIEEADQEEEDKIRWKKSQVRKHLLDFRKWLYENKSEGTVGRYMGCIKTLYTYFEIELRPLPGFNSKGIDKTYVKKYEDIPSRDELIDTYYEAENVVKCTLLCGISTGMSRADILNKTVEDFFIACEDYINLEDSVMTNLKRLRDTRNVIPCFEGERQKTKTRFTTFGSPEFVEHTVQYLIGRDAQIRAAYDKANDDNKHFLPCKLELSDKLFDINPHTLSANFRRINTKLRFGKVGKFTKIRTHQFRSFHATTLLNLENNPFTESEVDALQGRTKDKTHRAYFIESKSKLRQKYIEAVDNLMLFKSIHQVDSAEYEKIKAENDYYKESLEAQNERINKILDNQRELEEMIRLEE